MNGACINENGNFKLCPYRVFTDNQGDFVTQKFCKCVGKDCVAYHVGICLRVVGAVKDVR